MSKIDELKGKAKKMADDAKAAMDKKVVETMSNPQAMEKVAKAAGKAAEAKEKAKKFFGGFGKK